MNISVVIPLLNEKESLRELTDSLIDVMKSYNFSYEIIFIDDGSIDNSWDIIEELSSKSDTIKGIKFHRNYGKSQALHASKEMLENFGTPSDVISATMLSLIHI